MLAGLSLRGNRAMRSFLHALQKHPQTIFVLQVGQSLQKVTLQNNTGTKLLDSADMSWFGLLHFISEELATATFMETDRKELFQIYSTKCIPNETQTETPAVQPQKAKHSHSAATI